jgi:hypothetical protein
MSVHEMGEIDLLDSILSPMFVAAALAGTGIATISIMGVGFADPLMAAQGSEITVSLVLGLAALGAAFATNQVGPDDWDNTELGVVLLALLLMVAVSVVPIVRELVYGSPLFALPIVIVESAAYYLIAYY